MWRLVLITSFLALGIACTKTNASPTEPSPSGEDTEDGTGEKTEAPAMCEPPKLDFVRAKIEIEPTRDHHVTLIHEVAGTPYLYVLGGEQEDFKIVLDDIQRARINDDGSLEPFEKIGTLPRGRAGAALAVVGDDVILAGGVATKPFGFTDETAVARFDEEGRLDDWKIGPPLPSKVQHAAAVVVDHDIYITGGTLGSAPVSFAIRTTLGADGTLGPFESQHDLEPSRSHHAAFVMNDAVYLVGGLDQGPLDNPPSLSDVVRAKIGAGGKLGKWEAAGDLGSHLSVSAAQVVGCSVLFVGGLDDSKKGPFSAKVLRGTVDVDGMFHAEGALAAKLSTPRGHVHQTPVFNGKFMYSIGGRGNDLGTLGVVEIGTLTP